MRRCLRNALLGGLIAAALIVPVAASAVTIDQVVGLARAGVTDTVILALIDRDKTIFAIDSDQLLRLQREGVSEPVILAMLKSGRAEGDDAARADAADTAAFIASTLAPGPELVIVGHGPERPNTAHADGFYSAPGVGPYIGVPYGGFPYGGLAYGSVGGRRRSRGVAPVVVPSTPFTAPMVPFTPPYNSPFQTPYNSPFRQPVIPPVGRGAIDPPALCYAQVATRSSSAASGFVTECPTVMQAGRR
jgi:hypothetical protein